jgi:hypothetical protein
MLGAVMKSGCLPCPALSCAPLYTCNLSTVGVHNRSAALSRPLLDCFRTALKTRLRTRHGRPFLPRIISTSQVSIRQISHNFSGSNADHVIGCAKQSRWYVSPPHLNVHDPHRAHWRPRHRQPERLHPGVGVLAPHRRTILITPHHGAPFQAMRRRGQLRGCPASAEVLFLDQVESATQPLGGNAPIGGVGQGRAQTAVQEAKPLVKAQDPAQGKRKSEYDRSGAWQHFEARAMRGWASSAVSSGTLSFPCLLLARWHKRQAACPCQETWANSKVRAHKQVSLRCQFEVQKVTGGSSGCKHCSLEAEMTPGLRTPDLKRPASVSWGLLGQLILYHQIGS